MKKSILDYAASRVMQRAATVVALVVALMAPAAGRAQNLKCFILTPPEQLLEGVKKVAIMDFEVATSFHAEEPPSSQKKSNTELILEALTKKDAANDEQRFSDSGVQLADMMTALLLEDDRGIYDIGTGFLGLGGSREGKSFQQGARTDIFTVVERSRIAQVLNELNLGQSGAINEAQAAQVGQLLGVDAIITGTLTVSCHDRWIKRDREDKKRGKYQVDCHQRFADASASIRFIKVETAEVIGSKQSRHKAEPETCSENMASDLGAPETTIGECLRAVATELVNYFAPRFEYQKMDFAKIEGDEYKRLHETSKKSLERYDLDNAHVIYTTIAEQDPYNHAALFNLGVLHDAVGNYKLAQEKYAIAAKLRSKEGKYTKAQERVAKQVAFWEKLNTLGIFMQERTFQVSQEQMAAATVARIQVNGSGSDRISIRSASDPSSQTLVKVPGEIELELVAAAGEWYKVRLLDGREGFLAKRDGKILQ